MQRRNIKLKMTGLWSEKGAGSDSSLDRLQCFERVINSFCFDITVIKPIFCGASRLSGTIAPCWSSTYFFNLELHFLTNSQVFDTVYISVLCCFVFVVMSFHLSWLFCASLCHLLILHRLILTFISLYIFWILSCYLSYDVDSEILSIFLSL